MQRFDKQHVEGMKVKKKTQWIRPIWVMHTATPQNHSMAVVGTSGDFAVPPWIIQGQLQKAAQGHAQLGFEYAQGWRIHTLSKLLLSNFDQCHSMKFFFSNMCV